MGRGRGRGWGGEGAEEEENDGEGKGEGEGEVLATVSSRSAGEVRGTYDYPVLALLGWDSGGVTAAATVALGALAAASIVANALLVRASFRQARSSADAVDVQRRQLVLARDELTLVERQVAVMERQAAIQESASARRARQAFPQIEVQATELGPSEVTGHVQYTSGLDPAEEVEVWVWFRRQHYRARVGRVVPSPAGTSFSATPVGGDALGESRVPTWALSRGPRVDAVSWRDHDPAGGWWAQRLDDQGQRLGLPDRGEWPVPGAEQLPDF